MSERNNQAVDRLAAALHELAYRGRISLKPDVRMLILPGSPVPEDVRHLHGVGLSADMADLLADAIEHLLRSGEPIGHQAATDFARSNPELAQDVASAFTGLDMDALARTVLNDTAPDDRAAVTRALDAMFRPTQDDQQEDGDDA